MGLEKRKREDEGEVDGKRVKIIGDDGDKTTTVTVTADDEVEEFFAILRRVSIAVKYFKEGNSEKGLDSTESKRRSLSFQPEDFDGLNGGGGGREKVGDNGGLQLLDLNLDPNVDHIVSKSAQ